MTRPRHQPAPVASYSWPSSPTSGHQQRRAVLHPPPGPGRTPFATRSRCIPTSQGYARDGHTLRSWTRSATRTPPAPASARPSSPAVTSSSRAFDVVLERIARGRPERSIVLTGLRGVGKTVLLNALRSAAVRADWGTGKLEARPDQRLRRPLSAALHMAVRELGHPAGDEVDHVLGVLKAFALRDAAPGAQAAREAGTPASTPPPSTGRADSGDIEIDLVELLTDVGGLAADVGQGRRHVHRRDAGPRSRRRVGDLRGLPRDLAVGAARDRRRRRAAAPAGRAVGVASPTPSDCSATSASTGSTGPRPTSRSSRRPSEEDVEFSRRRWMRCMRVDRRLPVLRPGLRQGRLGRRAALAHHRRRTSRVAAPEAEAELAVGFFGSRFERATPAEREYLRAMADAAQPLATAGDGRSTTPSRCRPSAVAARARPQAPVAVAGPRRAAEEGADLLRGARPDRVHGAALRPLPAHPRG